MSRGAPIWFETVWNYGVEAINYWIIFSNENLIKSKLKKLLEMETFMVLLQSPRWVKFNKKKFTIFRAKVWNILILEWILLLEIQTNCKNWVWKGKITWALIVFTLGPMAQATLMFSYQIIFTNTYVGTLMEYFGT
jgi:hypothetical protein